MARSAVYRWLERWQEKAPELIAAEEAGATQETLVAKVRRGLAATLRTGGEVDW